VGPGSLEFDLMERAGCDPVTASADDPYPQWSLEQLVQDDPDVYLVAEGVPVEQVSSQEGIRDLTAVRLGRIHEVNADLISRPGPRVAQGIEELAALLHGAAA
jgi:iron complex transport system substrate-binding protein